MREGTEHSSQSQQGLALIPVSGKEGGQQPAVSGWVGLLAAVGVAEGAETPLQSGWGVAWAAAQEGGGFGMAWKPEGRVAPAWMKQA